MRDLTASERAVWLTLWRYEKNGVSEVSHNHLAELGGMSRRAAIMAVESLTEKKLIRRTTKGNNRQHTSNKYVLKTPT